MSIKVSFFSQCQSLNGGDNSFGELGGVDGGRQGFQGDCGGRERVRILMRALFIEALGPWQGAVRCWAVGLRGYLREVGVEGRER